MKQYEMAELTFCKMAPTGSFAEVQLTGDFCCEHEKVTVKGFYAGDGIYKVRFLPKYAGTYTYRIRGVIETEGILNIEPAQGKHGIVVAKDTHFEYEEGTRYIPFGTTIYAFFHQEKALINKTMETLKNAPFNKVRLCVFPKHYDYNHNEPELFAFEKDENGAWDVHRPCFAFWENFEQYMFQLDDMGIEVDLILFHPYDRWGFSKFSQKDNLTYLDYLLRRFAAIPNVWWSLANEYDLCDAKSIRDWEEIEEYVANNDPYHHLLSNHNCFQPWDFSRKNITHVCVQTKTVSRVQSLMKKYGKPVMIDECCYEGNLPKLWGSLSGKEMTSRFWRVYTTGGFCTHGDTFIAEDEILWWAKGGVLKGESPKRIAFLREIMESIPGPLTPVVNFVDKIMSASKEELQLLKENRPAQFSSMIDAVRRSDADTLQVVSDYEKEYAAWYKDEVYLKYYYLNCSVTDTLDLPEDGKYTIEYIDTWNMTKKVIMTGASGKTIVSLPGIEGMALLARQENE